MFEFIFNVLNKKLIRFFYMNLCIEILKKIIKNPYKIYILDFAFYFIKFSLFSI